MTRTFRVTYEPDPEVDEVIAEILAEMPEVVEVGMCKWGTFVNDKFAGYPSCISMEFKRLPSDYKYCPFCGAKIERQ